MNSAAVGRYEDYVAGELVELVDRRYAPRPGRRAVVGKSSGGFGALHLAMHRPGTFGAVGSVGSSVKWRTISIRSVGRSAVSSWARSATRRASWGVS